MPISFIRNCSFTFDEVGNQTSISTNFDGSGNDTLLVVGCRSTATGTQRISGVTYGGESLTLLHQLDVGTSYYDFFYKIGPKTGTNTLQANRGSASGGLIFFNGCLYGGINQHSNPNVSGTNTTSSTSITKTLTTTKNNCWGLAFCVTSGSTLSVDENLTFRTSTSYQLPIGDTNGNISPAGNITMGFNVTPTRDMGIIMSCFSPALKPQVSGFLL